MSQRQRGVVLTDCGLKRLEQAIAIAQEKEKYGKGFTQPELEERTGISIKTIKKIRQGTQGVDRAKLEDVFAAFGLPLEPADYGIFERPTEAAGTAAPLEPLATASLHQPSLWLVPRHNRFFAGREAIVTALRQQFGDWQTHSQPVLQALSGLGGIGKTQIAVAYAYRYQAHYTAVLWVQAATETRRLASLQAIAQALQLPTLHPSSPDAIITTVRTWLTQNAGWLLVCDDLDQSEALRSLLPSWGQGHVLITARTPRFDSLGLAQPVYIDPLSAEDAVAFLLQRTGRSHEDVDELHATQAIAAEVGGLPLALEQAAAYILVCQLRFQDYLVAFRQQKLAILERSQPVMGDYPESVATTWALNFQAVAATSPAAADLLRISAFLAPEAIPYELFEQRMIVLGDTPLAAALAQAEQDPTCVPALLAPLARYSLVTINPTERTYSLHRLVQAAVQQVLLDDTTSKQWQIFAIELVGTVFPDSEVEQREQCDRLIAHGLVGQAWITTLDYCSPQAAQLLHHVGQYLLWQGRYTAAEATLQAALTQRQQLFAPPHRAIAASLSQLGALRRAQGHHSEAETLYQQALKDLENVVEPNSLELATSLNRLGLLYRDQSRLEEAVPLHQRALAIRQSAYGSQDHLSVATSLNDLGLLLWQKGSYNLAESRLLQALAMYERLEGAMSLASAPSMNNLALVHKAQGRYQEAEVLYRKALEIYRQTLGENHPNVATALHNLGGLFKAKQNFDLAQEYYDQASILRRQLLGECHPLLASSLHQLAAVSAYLGDLTQAQELYQQALEMRSTLLGKQHPATLKTLTALSELPIELV